MSIAIIFIFVVSIFLSVLKEKNRKLRRLISENDYLHKIIDSANEGIYVTDVRRKFIIWNEASQRISGYSKEDVMGRYCFDNILDHTDENGKNLCHDHCLLVKSMNDRKSYGPEVLYLKHRNGCKIPVEIMTGPIFDMEGNVIGGVETFRDITERLEKERLTVEKKQLEVVIALAGAAAHELRQPLQAIIALLSLMRNDLSDNSEIKGYLDDIEKSCYRINNIIKKMGTITDYKIKDYAGNIKILDIDKSSDILP
ncbi:PAS domain S-box protein [Dissulfurispira thermophila]|uniref:PAS domain S-box protein n=1 Tax=Dissulfurispira thermophila TaxID=2715679 RepID=UPI00193E5569|nr:PAS domain S-box protein [Dissulfurispira thermophila]